MDIHTLNYVEACETLINSLVPNLVLPDSYLIEDFIGKSNHSHLQIDTWSYLCKCKLKWRLGLGFLSTEIAISNISCGFCLKLLNSLARRDIPLSNYGKVRCFSFQHLKDYIICDRSILEVGYYRMHLAWMINSMRIRLLSSEYLISIALCDIIKELCPIIDYDIPWAFIL